jgi:hypothetical protein
VFGQPESGAEWSLLSSSRLQQPLKGIGGEQGGRLWPVGQLHFVQSTPVSSFAPARRRRQSSSTIMAPLRMSDNRTVAILRKAHDEGYGVLAQVIYDFQMRDL